METVYPPGAPIFPNLLRWQGLEVYEYICAFAALHLRQTRRLQDLGASSRKKCKEGHSSLFHETLGGYPVQPLRSQGEGHGDLFAGTKTLNSRALALLQGQGVPARLQGLH